MRNAAGVTAPLRDLESQRARRSTPRGKGGFSIDPRPAQTITDRDVANRWLDLAAFDKPPMTAALSGLELEYRIVQLYARDAGKREASIAVDVGQGSQDIGFRNDAPLLFTVRPSTEVTLRVLDEQTRPDLGVVRDRGRAGARLSLAGQAARARLRLPPAGLSRDGETIRLPEGDYDVEFTRGPEYVDVATEAHRRPRADDRDVSRSSAGSISPRAAGIPAIITSTPPAACTTRRRRWASNRAT